MDEETRDLTIEQDGQKGSFIGNLVLVLIAVGFLAGLFPLTKMAFGPLVNSVRAAQWEQADGVVLSSFVDVPHRRQYRIEARFVYTWDGASYTSETVFFDDTVGVRKSYYQDVNRQLLRHKSARNPIDVWVNPDKPAQAVIFRHIRWDKFAGNSFFLAVWGAIAFVLVGSVLSAWRRK